MITERADKEVIKGIRANLTDAFGYLSFAQYRIKGKDITADRDLYDVKTPLLKIEGQLKEIWKNDN